MEVSDERKKSVTAKVTGAAWFRRLRSVKNIRVIAVIFIIAVALLIYSTVAAGVRETTAREDTGVSSMDEEETRLAAVLGGIEGAGRVQTMITRDGDDRIVGVLVIAEGADDITVMLRLLAATTTALGVDRQIVDVYTMK